MFSWIRHWPQIALKCAAVVFILLAIGAWRTWALHNAKPEPSINYLAQLNELVQRVQPEGENAWPLYRRILSREFGITGSQSETTPLARELQQFIRQTTLLHSNWDQIDRTAEVATLDKFQPLLQMLDHAAEHSAYFMPYNIDGVLTDDPIPFDLSKPLQKMPLSALSGLNMLRRLNTLAFRAAFERGDWNEALRRLRTGLRIGDHLSNRLFLIEQALAYSSVERILVEASQTLDSTEVSPDHASEMLNALAELRFSTRDLAPRFIEAEQTAWKDMVQWVHSRNGVFLPNAFFDFYEEYGNSPMLPMQTFPRMNIAGPWLGGASMAINQIAEINQFELEMIDQALRDDADGLWDAFFFDRAWHPVPAFFGFKLNFYYRRSLRLDSLVAGLRLMLLLEIYHAETGDWPELVTSAVSIENATDPVSGDLFIYERTPLDEHGRPYELRIPWLDSGDPQAIVNRPREALPAAPPVPYEVID